MVQHSKRHVVGGLAPSTPLISCQGLVLGTPIEAPKAPMTQQIAPGSSRREVVQVQGSQVPGPLRTSVRGESPGWGSEARLRSATRHSSERPGSAAAGVPAAAQAGATASLHAVEALPKFRCGRQGGLRWRSDGLWRHLLRKPRRKCGSPGGLRRSFFAVAREPPVRTISPNNYLNYLQKCL